MQDDTSTTRKVPFLLRRVTVPSWLQAIILITWVYCLVDLLITHPQFLVLGIVGSILFGVFVRNPLRRRVGQDPKMDAQEIHEAPDRNSAAAAAWRQLRTYQVWHLTILVTATILVLLDLAGVPTP